MRIVVVGATGNVGTSVLEALGRDDAVDSILGLARRRATAPYAKTEFAAVDVTRDDLVPHFRGADCVVHLAWLLQPARDTKLLWRVNVEGTSRLLAAVQGAGVENLVYASSVGVYSPGPKDRNVDESWPRDGVPTSFYGRHKAEVESLLDRFEQEQPAVRVVRMRPALIFKREAASGVRRLFLGPLLPSPLVRRALIQLLPAVPKLRFQAVHSRDVGEAYRLAVVSDVRGPFNLAADPVLDGPTLARIFDARAVRVPADILRGAAGLSWRLRLQPTPAGWVDLGLGVPLLDVGRAVSELGWRPRRGADEAVLELAEGIRTGAGLETAPLAPRSGGRARWRELVGGVGSRDL